MGRQRRHEPSGSAFLANVALALSLASALGCGSSASNGAPAQQTEASVPADAEGEGIAPGESGSFDAQVTDSTSVGSDAAQAGCPAYASAFCSQLLACDPADFRAFFYGTVQACESDVAASCEAERKAPGTSTTSASISECAHELSLLTCGPFLTGSPPGCLLPGTLATGAGCEFSSQCQSSFCSITSGWCGTCQSRVGLGGACIPAADTRFVSCMSGLACTSSSGCQKPVALGGVCDSTATGQCSAPNVCIANKCSSPVQLGSACAQSSDCAAGAFCSGSGSTGTCTANTYKDAGESCDLGRGTLCSADLLCSAGGMSAVTGTCTPLASSGQSCVGDFECVTSTLCVGGHCQVRADAATCP
jgi:hypothetical protein